MPLLNKQQARAVYRVMLECRNVSGRPHIRFDREDGHVLHVAEYKDGTISVFEGDVIGNTYNSKHEKYASAAEFALHYYNLKD